MRTTHRTSSRAQLSEAVRSLPIDLILLVVLVAAADVVLLYPGPLPSITGVLRPLLALPLLFLAPGYAVVAALFPGRRIVASPSSPLGALGKRLPTLERSFDLPERLALGFGVSVALLGIVGLVFGAFGALTLLVIAPVLNLVVALGVLVGSVRRLRHPINDRFQPRAGVWIRSVYNTAFRADSGVELTINVALLLAVLVAASTLAYAVSAPLGGASYASLVLLSQNDAGELVASDYPTEFTRGQGQPLTVAVENHEHHRQTYTVVVALERVDRSDGSVTVTDRVELQRIQRTIDAGGTWQARHTITPTMAGEDLRLMYYLYQGDAPERADSDSAYRTTYLWIDVSGGGD